MSDQTYPTPLPSILHDAILDSAPDPHRAEADVFKAVQGRECPDCTPAGSTETVEGDDA